MNEKLSVGDIIARGFIDFISKYKPSPSVINILRKIIWCRTRFMGGHELVCPTCGKQTIHYNSCRNRNCPKCQGSERIQWIERQEALLLPVPYFHIIFTLPHELNATLLHNQEVGYKALLTAVSETLKSFGNTNGVQIGATIMLHTWSATLDYHVHAHALVTGGGIDNEGNWKQISRKRYLFNVKNLSKCFRAKFLSYYPKKLIDSTTRKAIFEKPWNVFSKRCSDGSGDNLAKKVISYLGRYFNRAPIANSRIVSIDDKNVTFKYKNYRDKSLENGFYPIKEMTLALSEFIRRFTMHILPKGLQKTKHIGLHAPSVRKKLIALQIKMGINNVKTVLDKSTKWICPECKSEMNAVCEIVSMICHGLSFRSPPSPSALKNYLPREYHY